MTDKTCRSCLWVDPYMDHNYGFCDEKQVWVNLDSKCEDIKVDEGKENADESRTADCSE